MQEGTPGAIATRIARGQTFASVIEHQADGQRNQCLPSPEELAAIYAADAAAKKRDRLRRLPAKVQAALEALLRY